MKKFLRILIAIMVLLLILAIVAIFLSPKKMVLSESITIDAPAIMIYNQVNDFKRYPQWSPWTKMDPNAINTYSENISGVGAQWTWKGNDKIGEGTQKIIAVDPGKSIKMSLETNSFDGTSFINWTFVPDGNKTKVTWDYDGAETLLFLRPFNIIFKGGLKNTFKEGLSNLKTLVEERTKTKVYNGFKINEFELPEKNYLTIRQEVKMDNIQQFYGRTLPALIGKVNAVGVEMDGKEGILFYKWDESNGVADMAVSIPIADIASVSGTTLETLPPSKVIQVDYYGDYKGSANAHYAIDEYLKDYGILTNVPIVEEYVTDTTVEQNPNKWLTKITYYIVEN